MRSREERLAHEEATGQTRQMELIDDKAQKAIIAAIHRRNKPPLRQGPSSRQGKEPAAQSARRQAGTTAPATAYYT
jgi:hypothetical protein